MAGKMGKKDYFVYELPFMFNDWKEYRDYLLEKLIDNEKWKKGFRAQFERHEKLYAEKLGNMIYKVHVQSILTNDWEFIKMANWERTFAPFRVRKEAKGERWYS
jgi:hypothetical protein